MATPFASAISCVNGRVIRREGGHRQQHHAGQQGERQQPEFVSLAPDRLAQRVWGAGKQYHRRHAPVLQHRQGHEHAQPRRSADPLRHVLRRLHPGTHVADRLAAQRGLHLAHGGQALPQVPSGRRNDHAALVQDAYRRQGYLLGRRARRVSAPGRSPPPGPRLATPSAGGPEGAAAPGPAPGPARRVAPCPKRPPVGPNRAPGSLRRGCGATFPSGRPRPTRRPALPARLRSGGSARSRTGGGSTAPRAAATAPAGC